MNHQLDHSTIRHEAHPSFICTFLDLVSMII